MNQTLFWHACLTETKITQKQSPITIKLAPTSETTPKSEPKISAVQTKKIYALVKEKGITTDQAKAYLKEVFNKMSTKELTLNEASRLIEDIESGKLKGGESALVKEAKRLGATELKKDE